jgi:sarcosine oxidase subunit beta
MTETYDAIVIGAGVVGASTAFHLAKLGGLKVCVIDAGAVCTGGTAKSCAIVRTHYSVPSNTALTVRSIAMFNEFGDWLEDPEAASGFVNSGYLIVAPEGDFADKMRRNLDLQSAAGAETFVVDAAAARDKHPLLQLDDAALVAYEPNSGYADPYLTTTSLLNAARKKGAVVQPHCPATRIVVEAGRVTGVDTPAGHLQAPLVVAAAGPWTPALAAPLGFDLPLEISRHIVLTLASDAPYTPDLPIVKDLVTGNKMYFRPASGGVVLVGTGDHGDPIDRPEDIDERVADDFLLLQGGQVAHRMPSFADARVTATWVGAYDITPDWNPVLGLVDGIAGLSLNVGFSGHGFKLAPALGLVLAQQLLGQPLEIDIAPYGHDRFASGRLLTGAYGEGSIS